MINRQCEFEQQPKYPRCEREADGVLITRIKLGMRGSGDKPHKAKYCNQHAGFVMQQLKGTYVRVISWALFNPAKVEAV